jgi:murein DD-endopeptidase MepM/ murein hydrolase activator NlpD
MKLPVIKEVVCIVIIFLTAYVFPGCTTYNRPNIEPPPRFKKELDSLRSDRTSLKSTKYTVKKGDTVWRIAYTHGVSPDRIIKVNHIKDITNIKPGQQLIIPAGFTGTRKTSSKATLTSTKYSSESFKWPLRGKKLTYFGQRIDGNKNTGVDIKAFYGQAVKASKSGVVALISDAPDGWGKVAILQHYDGSYTWYAHNSKISVKKGDRVAQGQTIAKAGRTGKAEQNKLHFKIFLHGIPVNPLYHLR